MPKILSSTVEADRDRRALQRHAAMTKQQGQSTAIRGGLPAPNMTSLLLHLQRTAGNQAVNSLLRRYTGSTVAIQREEQEDEDDTATDAGGQDGPISTPTDDQSASSAGDGGTTNPRTDDGSGADLSTDDGGNSQAAGGDSTTDSGGDAGDQAVALSGNVEPLDDPDPQLKAGPDRNEPAGLAGSANRQADAPDSVLRIDADLSLGYARQSGGGGHGPRKADSVTQALTVGSSVTKGGVTMGASDFGDEAAEYKADTISWTRDAGASAIKVVGRMFLDIHWDTQSLGKTPIAGAADAAVTAGTWKDVVKDLKPDGTGRPTRDTYWAPDLTAKHEQFHGTDDIGQANLFLPTVQAWLSSQTITVPAGPDPSAAIETKVRDLVEQARQKVKADGWAHYHSGGEDRAYADGKSSYQARVDGVTARAGTAHWA
jgi:hypothetical protein